MSTWYPLQPSRASSPRQAFSNDLFPQAWVEHAGIKRVALKVETKTAVLVKAFRYRTGLNRELVSTRYCPQGETILPLPDLTECGNRLSYAMYVRDREVTSEELGILADWVCDSPPLSEVGIAVVVCTRDRDDQLQTLINQFSPQMEDVTTCIIVNQGETDLRKRLILPNYSDKYKIFEQDNLGGAGGFTRGIIEALRNKVVTHVLLMDDDVEVDRGLFCRIRHALSYISPEICLGGVMADRDCSERLLSIGHGFDPIRAMTTDLLPHQGGSLRDERLRSYLERPIEVDFCGWWCFCFPREAVETCGLPLPLFLRGDDAEYGLRLKRAGFPTLMWPGVYVDHPNLGNQTRPWHHYYDRRNALVCAALHFGSVPSQAITRLVRGICNATALYRYAEARAGVRALQAYLDGAAGLELWCEQGHSALVADDELVQYSAEEQAVFLDTYSSPAKRTAITIFRVLFDLLSKKSSESSQSVHVDPESWNIGTVQRPKNISIVLNKKNVQIYRDPAQARSIFMSLLRLWWPVTTRHSRQPEYLLQLATPTWWAKRLGLMSD